MSCGKQVEVAFAHEDRQWDLRVNVQTDEYLGEIVKNIKLENAAGKYKYILVGGTEIGTRPTHSDYQIRHIHIALLFHNRASKASIIKNLGIVPGNGYYLVPRNRDLPYQGWRAHHTKEFSKISPQEIDGLVIFEDGELPRDSGKRAAPVLRSELEKKLKTNEIIIDMRELIQEGKEEEAFRKYPRNYMQYGEKLKSMIIQKKKSFHGKHINPHIYLFGYPGTGKTSLLKWIYPNTYKKDLTNRFFDLYDEKIHTHIMLEDLDSMAVDKLGIQFIKTLCDEAGFPIDQKYKTPQLTRATILVTSNQSIESLVETSDENRLVETTKIALRRRFFHLRVDQLQRMLGIKLINEYERKILKKEGNEDPSKLYLSWDYELDCPTGLPLKSVDEYQRIIRDLYYK